MTGDRPALPQIDFDRIGPRVGDRFPDIVLPDQSGQEVDLHRKRGSKPAIVALIRSAHW